MNSIFDLIQLITANVWLYGGAFVLVLSVLVFVHEWGHYWVARRCGVRVESFSIGFGRELFGITDKHGTRWKFSLIPLGGYVKMFGDTDPASSGHVKEVKDGESNAPRPLSKEEKEVAFYSQSVGRRAAIVFAGPAINFMFAILLLAILYVSHGQSVTPPLGSAIIQDSAAAEAGFMPHDEVIAIDGRRINRFEDIRREVMIGLDTPRTFSIRRNEEVVQIVATPQRLEEKDRFGFHMSRGMLGLIQPGNTVQVDRILSVDGVAYETREEKLAALESRMGQVFTIELDRGPEINTLIIQPVADLNPGLSDPDSELYGHLIIANTLEDALIQHGLLSGLFAAVNETANITLGTLSALGQMITGTRRATELGGIIRIGAIAGDMAQAGIIALITFTALLSINLGLINLFPIPMLDGGHLVFYGVEAVKGSPIGENVQEYAFRLGLAILVGIMLFANLNDIVQLIL